MRPSPRLWSTLEQVKPKKLDVAQLEKLKTDVIISGRA